MELNRVAVTERMLTSIDDRLLLLEGARKRLRNMDAHRSDFLFMLENLRDFVPKKGTNYICERDREVSGRIRDILKQLIYLEQAFDDLKESVCKPRGGYKDEG